MDKSAALNPEDFPFTIEALRSDNDEMVWGVTVLQPPAGERIQVPVPPLVAQEGVPIIVRTRTAEGVTVETGPYSA